MTTITITLPEPIQAALDDVIQEEGVSTNELFIEAVEQYLFQRRFRLLREQMVAKAQAQGIFTDDDVFSRVS